MAATREFMRKSGSEFGGFLSKAGQFKEWGQVEKERVFRGFGSVCLQKINHFHWRLHFSGFNSRIGKRRAFCDFF